MASLPDTLARTPAATTSASTGENLSLTNAERDLVRDQLSQAMEIPLDPLQTENSISPNDVSNFSSSAPHDLHDALNQLARLVANVTEAYTAAVFLANPQEKFVQLTAVHTLSRNVVPHSRIGYGCGLIGWTAQNAVRISVCPFEHDSTTLLYYSNDQALKSFIAVPIIDTQNRLLGVISCDSKKTYAFAKVTEKVLLDCASQAAALIMLHRRLDSTAKTARSVTEEELGTFLDQVRAQKSERTLLEQVADLPVSFVDRDALVVITTDEPGASAAAFYSPANQVRVGHRLLEVVCRHKRVICGHRSVQAQTVDDSKQRSFLSIPFHISKREAGSINLLSRAFEAFSAVEIATLEKVAEVLGKELELIRLREKYTSPEVKTGLLTWEQFSRLAEGALRPNETEKASNKGGFALNRLFLTNVHEFEDFLGVETSRKLLLKIMRLVEQAKGSQAIACYLYGTQMLILSERQEGERIAGRLKKLLERFSLSDENAFEVGNRQRNDRAKNQPGVNVQEMLRKNLFQVKVDTSSDGDTLEELMAKSNRLFEVAATGKSGEVIAHASNW